MEKKNKIIKNKYIIGGSIKYRNLKIKITSVYVLLY